MPLPPIKPPPGLLPNRSHPRYQGCVGHWLFNEGGGTTVHDLSGWGRDGTASAAMDVGSDWVLGVHGWSLEFDDTGQDEYVEIGDQDGLEGLVAITVCAWVKFDGGTPDDSVIVSKSKRDSIANIVWVLDYESSITKWQFAVSDGTVWANRRSSTNASTTEWTFVVATWDGINQDIYVNGFFDNGTISAGVPSTMHANAEPVRIGRENRAGAQGRWWDGKISEVRVYNRMLRPTEILSLYTDPFLEFRSTRILYAPEPVAAGGLSIPVAMHHYTKNIKAG